MAIFTTAQLDEAEDIIESMPYKAADEYDSWYPTKSELDSHITGKSKTDALFLMWLSSPATALPPEKDQVRKYIMKMLYKPEIVTLKD